MTYKFYTRSDGKQILSPNWIKKFIPFKKKTKQSVAEESVPISLSTCLYLYWCQSDIWLAYLFFGEKRRQNVWFTLSGICILVQAKWFCENSKWNGGKQGLPWGRKSTVLREYSSKKCSYINQWKLHQNRNTFWEYTHFAFLRVTELRGESCNGFLGFKCCGVNQAVVITNHQIIYFL